MGFSALLPPKGWLLSAPLITLLPPPHLEVIYFLLLLKGSQAQPKSSSISPWNKSGRRPFLPRPFSLEPALSSLIAIHEGSAGNMGCKSPNNCPEGMPHPLTGCTASQTIEQTLNGHKRTTVSPKLRLYGDMFPCNLQRKPVELAFLSEDTTKESVWT